jgi:hypothetical protein
MKGGASMARINVTLSDEQVEKVDVWAKEFGVSRARVLMMAFHKMDREEEIIAKLKKIPNTIWHSMLEDYAKAYPEDIKEQEIENKNRV